MESDKGFGAKEEQRRNGASVAINTINTCKKHNFRQSIREIMGKKSK